MISDAHLSGTLRKIEEICAEHGLLDHDGRLFLFKGPVHKIGIAKASEIMRRGYGYPDHTAGTRPGEHMDVVNHAESPEGHLVVLQRGRVNSFYVRERGRWVRKT